MNISFCRLNRIDEEHLRIMKKLRSYGISPSGDKAIDLAKLKKINKIESEMCECAFEIEDITLNAQTDPEIAEAVEEMRGANIIGWHNRIFLGL